MRVVFFGTPTFAAEILQALLKHKTQVVAVVSRPDKAQGRSKKLVPTPVKLVAESAQLPLYQPERTSDPEFLKVLASYQADLFVVVAYGEIVRQLVLDMPRLACINIHASLLPKYRGAAPIQRAIMAGESKTGISIMYMVKKMDAGDVINVGEVPVGPDTSFETCEKDLLKMGITKILESLDAFKEGLVQGTAQDESLVTFASKIEKEDGEMLWAQSAQELHNLVRALCPSPSAWCWVLLKGERKRLKVQKATILPSESWHPPGTVLPSSQKELCIQTHAGVLSLLQVQLEGRKSMPIAVFLNAVNKENLGFILK